MFVGLMLGILGLPVPEEVLLTFSGYLVYKGTFALLPTCVVGFLGSVCGITVSYTLGRTLGFRLVRRFGHILHVSVENLERMRDWFARSGKWLLTVGYFIPGVRHLTAIVAGASRLEMPVFALFAYMGALLWSLTFISIGYFFGEQWHQILRSFAHHRLIGVAAIAVALLTVSVIRRWTNKDCASWRGLFRL